MPKWREYMGMLTDEDYERRAKRPKKVKVYEPVTTGKVILLILAGLSLLFWIIAGLVVG